MPTQVINLEIEDMSLHNIVALVQTGVDILITRGSTPLAKITAARNGSEKRTTGVYKVEVHEAEEHERSLVDEFWFF